MHVNGILSLLVLLLRVVQARLLTYDMPFCDLPEEELEALQLEEQQRNGKPAAATCNGDGSSCGSAAAEGGSCKSNSQAGPARSGPAGKAKGMCHSEGSWGNSKLTWSTGNPSGQRVRGAGERRPDQCFKCRVAKPIVSSNACCLNLPAPCHDSHALHHLPLSRPKLFPCHSCSVCPKAGATSAGTGGSAYEGAALRRLPGGRRFSKGV